VSQAAVSQLGTHGFSSVSPRLWVAAPSERAHRGTHRSG
jgi:hypothetical protein